MVCVRKRNISVSFTHTKYMFVRGKTDNNRFWAVIYSNNSDFQCFEMISTTDIYKILLYLCLRASEYDQDIPQSQITDQKQVRPGNPTVMYHRLIHKTERKREGNIVAQ